MLNLQSRYTPNYQTFRPRFGNQTASNNLEDLRTVLKGFIEKQKPLVLPERDHFPTCIQRPLENAITTLTPFQLKRLIAEKQFGIAEETADIIYHLGTKVGLDTGIFSPNRLTEYRNKVESILSAGTTEAFEKMSQIAKESIRPEDIEKIQPYLPIRSPRQQTKLIHDFLTMFLVDYAVYTHQGKQETNFAAPTVVLKKMREESEELLEHLALRRKRMPNLSKLLSQIDTAPQYKKVAKKLIEIGKKALNYVQKDNPFNIENLIQFAIWKSSARTEFYYKNPKLEYDVAKHVAKSWEKLLEAVTFLLPLTR